MKKFYIFQLVFLTGLFIFILYLINQVEQKGLGSNLNLLLGAQPPKATMEQEAARGATLQNRAARILKEPKESKKVETTD